jgi:hypothetical protein
MDWPKNSGRSHHYETLTMRAFVVACLIAIVLAVAGYYVLSSIQIPVSEAFSTSAVRLN